MKPGRSRRGDDLLAELRRRASRTAASVASVVAGAADQLDQRHDRHRAEEVHADEARPARRARPPPASRSIEIELVLRGEDRGRRRDARRAPPERPLDRVVLEDGLDDEVGVRRRPPVDGRPDPAEHGRRRSSAVEPALGDGALEVAGDPRRGRPRPGRARARRARPVAGRGEDLGDAVAHQAGAGTRRPRSIVMAIVLQRRARTRRPSALASRRSAAAYGSSRCAATLVRRPARGAAGRAVAAARARRVARRSPRPAPRPAARRAGAVVSRPRGRGGGGPVERGEQLRDARAGRRRW